MTPLDRFLKNANTENGATVLRQLPRQRFIDVKAYRTFRMKASMPLFLLFIFRDPLRGIELSVDHNKSADLTLGKMHYLYSGAILFGYLFEFPLLPFSVFENFCAVNSTDFNPAAIRGVAPVVRNRELTVYGCSDTSVVIVANAVQIIDVMG